ncbi:MAG: glycosyltransferase family 87 protein [Gemmataceae bacterium]
MTTTPPHRPSIEPLPSIGVLVALMTLAASQIRENNFQDLFIYRAGAAVALTGESPYRAGAVRPQIEAQWPDDARLADNSGFFLPPAGIALFAPFAAVPWPAAKVLWVVVLVLAGLAAFALSRLFLPPDADQNPLLRPLVAAAVLLNPVTVAGVVVGQTSLVVLGCIIWGQVAWDGGYRRLAGPLWAVAFVKPHLALPLLPLAWYLGGWKRAAELAAWVAGLTAVGWLLAGAPSSLFADYLAYLADGHKAVAFNRAALNPQVTSWNRLLIGLGGPAVELNAPLILAGYAVWAGLVAGRVWQAGKPSPAWATAAAATGALLCSQVLGYELVLLALTVPLIRDLFRDGRRGLGWAFVAVLVLTSVPLEMAEPVFPSHRSLGVAVSAVLVVWSAAATRESPPVATGGH